MTDLLGQVISQASSMWGNIVTTLGLLGVAYITHVTSKRVKSVEGQVKNGHSTIMRNDMDQRHDETRRQNEEILRRVNMVGEEARLTRVDVQLVQTGVQEVRNEQARLAGRILILEKKGVS